jgi:DNA-binding MarR family transcriptional regulator
LPKEISIKLANIRHSIVEYETSLKLDGRMRINKFLNTSCLFQLTLTYAGLIGSIQKRLAKEDVHFLQALVLTGLFFEEAPVRPGTLAETFGQSKSNLSHALRDLERKGWIERRTHIEDARAYLFNLTKDGRRKVLRIIKILDSVEDAIEGAPGGKKLAQQLQLLRTIHQAVVPAV